MTKRLQLLHELVPTATEIALLVNPHSSAAEPNVRTAQQQASSYGQRRRVLRANTEQEIDAAFATFAQLHPGALRVENDPVLRARHAQLVALPARYAVPAVYQGPEAVEG